MAVNTKSYNVLCKEKQYSFISGKYITSKVVLLHAVYVAWKFLTQEYCWKIVKITCRLVQKKIPGHKDAVELQVLCQIP